MLKCGHVVVINVKLPKMIDINNIVPSQDGVTHINIYSKGKTELGKFLSNFTHSPFHHPTDGKFESIEGYWYWLSCKNDKLRDLYGFEAKKVGRELKGKDWVDSEEFRTKIKQAIIIKIMNMFYTNYNLFLNSTLPFTHYYVYENKIVEVREGKWIIDFITQTREVLKHFPSVNKG